MDSVDLEVLKTAVQWSHAGFATTLGVVVRTWGSAPRPAGSMLVIREDGHIKGSVSGGCIEDDLIERVRADTLSRQRPEVTLYGVSAEEAQRFGLPCGGTLQLVLEPVTAQSLLPDLLAAIDRYRHVVRHLDLASGEVTLETGNHRPDLEFDGHTLITTHGVALPAADHRRGPIVALLASMAQPLDYQVIVCDPREEYADEWIFQTWNLPGKCPTTWS